jgi:hypothetical protein
MKKKGIRSHEDLRWLDGIVPSLSFHVSKNAGYFFKTFPEFMSSTFSLFGSDD